MNTDKHGLSVEEITEKIIGCASKVSSGFGVGFPEKIYENALFHEIDNTGMEAQQQNPISVEYDGIYVGEFYSDLLVKSRNIIE